MWRAALNTCLPSSQSSRAGILQVHEMSLGRGHLLTDCAICRQVFGLEEQVLLSCSHAFHRHCLASYEKYAQQSEQQPPLLCLCMLLSGALSQPIEGDQAACSWAPQKIEHPEV